MLTVRSHQGYKVPVVMVPASAGHGRGAKLPENTANIALPGHNDVFTMVRPGIVSPLQAVGAGVVTFSALGNACLATLAPGR